MINHYKNLHLTILLKKADRKKHGGYTYLITDNWTSHSAYRTKKGLRRFLTITGLKMGKRVAYRTFALSGDYIRFTLMDEYAFRELNHTGKFTETPILDNGDYTKGLYGNGFIFLLNPNCKREILPYFHE